MHSRACSFSGPCHECIVRVATLMRAQHFMVTMCCSGTGGGVFGTCLSDMCGIHFRARSLSGGCSVDIAHVAQLCVPRMTLAYFF
jgi:hypothetical protein